MGDESNARIETELEVRAYLQDLKYAIQSGARIVFQVTRCVDETRTRRYTNRYTVEKLFPKENPEDALKRELLTLTVEEYMRTVKDIRFPQRSEMREFGKVYNGNEDVYIKIRVELLGQYGVANTYVMSFHYTEQAVTDDMFPYGKK